MTDDEKKKEESSDNDWKVMQERQFSQSLFKSGYFLFPPNEHENLPLDTYEVQSKAEAGVQSPHLSGDAAIEEEIWRLKGFSETSGPHDDESLENDAKHFAHAMMSEAAKHLQEVNLVTEEQAIYNESGGFSSFHNNVDDNVDDDKEPNDPSKSPRNLSSSKGGIFNMFPSEAWWKKQAASLYAQAKEANKYWSIIVTAALMGLVILGHRWWIHHLKLKSSNQDMKIHQVIRPMNRFKDVLLGSSQRGFGGITSGKY